MEVLSLLGPLTTRSSAAWLSDVINIDVVIKQLSGNEGRGGGKGTGDVGGVLGETLDRHAMCLTCVLSPLSIRD